MPDTNANSASLEITSAPLLNSRYPGSLPFQDHPIQRELFFGRETEKGILLNKILAEDLVVFYSRSGLGKTSLLNAGVLEQLRKRGFFPLMCRVYATKRNESGSESTLDPLQSIYVSIDREIDKAKIKDFLAEYIEGKKDTLWEYFKTVEFWSADDVLLTPVLILDQFEELFDEHSPEARQIFAEQLADLVRGSIPKSLREKYRARTVSSESQFPYTEAPPKVKILISLREEYLGHLDELAQELPSIRKNEFRITPLTVDKAKRAIEEPAKKEITKAEGSDFTPAFSYAPETIDEILEFLCNPEESDKRKQIKVKNEEVDPSQLQLLTQSIEEKIRKRSSLDPNEKIIVDRSIVHGRDEMREIIQDFYERVLEQFPPSQRSNVIDLFENENKGLISPAGKRLSRAQEVIQHDFRIEDDMLNKLQEKRLLRSERRLEEFYYELSHDTLIKPILEARKKRKEKKAKGRLIKYIIASSSIVTLVLISLLLYIFWPHIQGQFGSTDKRIKYYMDYGKKDYNNGYFKQAESNLNIAYRLATGGMEKDKNKMFPIFPDLCVDLAETYFAQEKYKKAINKYDEAIKFYTELSEKLQEQKNKLKLEALFGSANAHTAIKNYDSAIENYEIAKVFNPNNPSLLNLAVSYVMGGKSSDALETINSLNKSIDINDPNAQKNLLNGYENLIEKDSEGKFALLRYGLGQIYMLKGSFKNAENEFLNAVKIARNENDPNLPIYYLNLAESYLAQKDYYNAIRYYNAAIASLTTPEDKGKAYYGLGNAHSAENNWPEAINDYEEAINNDYPDGRIYIYLAEAYLNNNQKQEALKNVKFFFNALEISGSLNGISNDNEFLAKAENLQKTLSKNSRNTIKQPEGPK